jgi:hypothetical protein
MQAVAGTQLTEQQLRAVLGVRVAYINNAVTLAHRRPALIDQLQAGSLAAPLHRAARTCQTPHAQQRVHGGIWGSPDPSFPDPAVPTAPCQRPAVSHPAQAHI